MDVEFYCSVDLGSLSGRLRLDKISIALCGQPAGCQFFVRFHFSTAPSIWHRKLLTVGINCQLAVTLLAFVAIVVEGELRHFP